jgi:hypothetical protein
MPKSLSERETTDDSIGWKKCDEAVQGEEMEIRHVEEKIVIREKWYENVFSLRPHHCVQHLLEAADGGSRFETGRLFSLRMSWFF